MEIQDFHGLTKFKIILPLFYMCGWISMILGPVFFDVVYQKICIFVLIYADIKVVIMLTIMVIITIKSNKLFNRFSHDKISGNSTVRCQLDIAEGINYGFILPNYKQEIEMMAETLDILASHSRARDRYLIFLAMEAHEEGSELKAKELMERYKQKFRLINYTRHEVRPFQQKGKASNVSWCAEHLQPFFENYMIDPQSVILTILDADSWAPDLYFDVMEEHLIKNYSNRHKFIYQPPQISTRNNLDVPIFTRVYDMMHSFVHCSNLFSVFNVTFPYSNYSLSYVLAKRIGYWDTCADAIGQDFHTTQKAYWKTAGQVTGVPIYVPFNQLNLSTGKGYIEDVVGRFWQAERHAQGASDLAWQFKMLFTHKFQFNSFIVFYQVLQTFLFPAILPWVFISMFLQTLVLYQGVEPSPELIDPIYSSILFNFLNIMTMVGYFLYQIFKRRANKLIYRRQNESILRIFEYPSLFVVNLFGISVPSFTLATFGSLLSNREYIVAEKKIKNNNNKS